MNKNLMAIKMIQENNLTWVNIDQVNEETLTYLKTQQNFHHLDLEDIQSEAQTPKLDIYKNYLFIVLQLPQWKAETETVVAQEVDVFITENFLITIEHGKSREMKDVFYRCLKNRNVKKDWMGQSTGYLFSQIVDELFHTFQPIVNSIGKRVNEIEESVFSPHSDGYSVRKLAKYRRNVLQLRRIIDPQKYLIANLSHIRKPFLNEETSLYYDDVHDYLSKLWSIVETYNDSIHGLHITVESLINQRTNKLISSLTIISVSLLPLNLLSGIYGMNISALPFAQKPAYVWAMFGVLTLIILLTIYLMKRKRRI